MEKIKSDLRETEVKQKSLVKQATSLMMFAAQWKDVEERFESTRSELESRCREVEEREKDVQLRQTKLEVEMAATEAELCGLEKLKEEKLKEVIESKNWLHSLKELIEEHSDEVMVQEKRLSDVESFVKEKERECEAIEGRVREKGKKLNWVKKVLEEKSNSFSSLEKSMGEWSSRLDFKARVLELKEKEFDKRVSERLGSVELKEKKLEELQKSRKDGEGHLDRMSKRLQMKESYLEDKAKELATKQRDFDLLKKSAQQLTQNLKSKEKLLDVQAKELAAKHNEFDSIKKSNEELTRNQEKQLDDQAKELAKKQELFDSIKKSNEERSEDLKSKERQLEVQAEELAVKQKEFDSIKKSTEEHIENLKLQQEVQAKEIELKWKELDSTIKANEERIDNLNSKERQLHDQAKELELKRKEFVLNRQSIEERTQDLNSKERQLTEQAEELESKQKELDSVKKSIEERTRNLKAKEKASIVHSIVKNEQVELPSSNNAVVPCAASNQINTNRDGGGLQLFMNENLRRMDLVGSEISANIEASSDPGKLVLDAMEGFYPSNLTVDKRGNAFDLIVVRRSCILLLEALTKASPQINPQVREEAIKLAGDWMAKMTVATDNWMEVLGFLRLVTAYGITSAYDPKELQNLVAIVSQHEQATEFSQAIGTADNASAVVCFPVKSEKPESSLAKNGAIVSSPNLQPTVTTDARNLQGFLNELSRGNHLIQNETLAALQMSSDPGKFVLDVIQNSFPRYWENRDVRFKENVMLSYINLLEQLRGVLPPHVGLDVKHDALKLTFQWKAKVRADTPNPLELLGLFQLIAAYGFVSFFAMDEILMLLGRISQHKQTRELCQTLGFADKIPGHYIQNLIDRNQLLEAVRLVCTFKLIDAFPPVPLLEKFVENTKDSSRKICRKMRNIDEKDKAIDDEIADLRSVIQCINDFNLESEYPSQNIEMIIAFVKKIKEYWRQGKALASKVGQQQQSKAVAPKVQQQGMNMFGQQPWQNRANKRRKKQQQQHQNKFQRTSAGRAYAMPPDYPAHAPVT